MNKIFIAMSAALMALATPAVAQSSAFSGLRGEVTAGYDDVTAAPDTTDVTYGAAVGIDFPVTTNVIAGVEANVDNVFDRRDIGASARLGYALNENFLVYGKAGYANYADVFSQKLDGLRVGGGVEYNVSDATYIKVEYRYTDFESGVGKHGVLGGIGIRF